MKQTTNIKGCSRGSAVHFTGRGLPTPGFEPELGGTPEHPEGIWAVESPEVPWGAPAARSGLGPNLLAGKQKLTGRGLPAPPYSAPTKDIP